MRTHFDLVILGSGSTAFAAALRALERGKTVLMTEERTIGGMKIVAISRFKNPWKLSCCTE